MPKKFMFKGKVSVFDPPKAEEKDRCGDLRPGTIKELFDASFGVEKTDVTLFFNNPAEASVAIFAKQLHTALANAKTKKFADLEEFLERVYEGYVDVSPSPMKGRLVEEEDVPKFPVA